MLRSWRSRVGAGAAVGALAAGAVAVPVLGAGSSGSSGSSVSAGSGGPAHLVDVAAASSSGAPAPQAGGYFDLAKGVDLMATPSAITEVDAYCRQSGQVFGIYDLHTRIPIVGGDFTGGGTATLRYPYGTQLVTVQLVGHVDANGAVGSLSTVNGSPTRCDAVQFNAPFQGGDAQP